MKVASGEAHTNHHPDHTGASSARRARRQTPLQGASEAAHRASLFAKRLSLQIDGQVRGRPYVVLTVACAVAAAAGVILSSRVLRGVLTATGTALAIDVLRELARAPGARADAG
jgi:hypothetical protein